MSASPRARMTAIVGLAAVVAAGAVAGVTLLQTHGERTTVPGAVVAPRAGYPPLQLEFGVRQDAQARALGAAQTLYNRGKVGQAARVFARYGSLEARLAAAFAAWKRTGLDPVRRLAAAHPRSPLVQLHLGWADYWAGRNADALAAWQRAASLGADSPYGVDAQDALHPAFTIPGLPLLVTGTTLPEAIRKLPPPQQLAALRAAAAGGGEREKLRYGVALWNLRRPVSAERQFAGAAKLAPGDPVARVAAAVGRFTKSDPAKAFGKLGPLTAVFPRSPVVEFHLGLLLLWIAEREKALRHLRATVADAPQSIYAKDARALLARLANNGTK
ncbi:MAG TPA: hypothetical protein VFJ91_03490 [Gaiellaceae bacterium]|nr:hypothetical protein [Gaiellaceae bacterium]